MSNLAVHIATTKIYKLKTAASAVTFFSADDSTTNAPSKYNNNNNNNIYLLQLGCYPVAVVILHVYKT